jgi:hypothetical protein
MLSVAKHLTEVFWCIPLSFRSDPSSQTAIALYNHAILPIPPASDLAYAQLTMPKKTARTTKKANTKKTSVKRSPRDTRLQKLKAAIKKRPAFCDERLAPEVDQELLQALVRKELPDGTARDTLRFVESFKSWSDAYCELLAREFRA